MTDQTGPNFGAADMRPEMFAARPMSRTWPVWLLAIPGAVAILGSFFIVNQSVKLSALAFGAALVLFAFIASLVKIARA